MKLYCRTCNTELTQELEELTNKALINHEPGTDYIPKGFFIFIDLENISEPNCNSGFGRERNIAINLKDLVNTRHHTNPARLNGCCGLDGNDGINTLCINMHEIGIESSDCWMAHEFTFDAKLVKGRNVKTYALSDYKLDLGQPFIDFAKGLHLCKDEDLLKHIQSGHIEIDNTLWQNAEKKIYRANIQNGSILRFFDLEIKFQIWIDDNGLK